MSHLKSRTPVHPDLLKAWVERAERAEARVAELETALVDCRGQLEMLYIARTRIGEDESGWTTVLDTLTRANEALGALVFEVERGAVPSGGGEESEPRAHASHDETSASERVESSHERADVGEDLGGGRGRLLDPSAHDVRGVRVSGDAVASEAPRPSDAFLEHENDGTHR